MPHGHSAFPGDTRPSLHRSTSGWERARPPHQQLPRHSRKHRPPAHQLPQVSEARRTSLTHLRSIFLDKFWKEQDHWELEVGNRSGAPHRASVTTTGLTQTARLNSGHGLTCNELFVLNDRDVSIETRKVKKVGPGNPDLVNVGALPVIEAAPWGQHQHPLLGLQQRLQEGGHTNVHIPAEVEALWGVDVIQKVPGGGKESGSSARRCPQACGADSGLSRAWEFTEKGAASSFLDNPSLTEPMRRAILAPAERLATIRHLDQQSLSDQCLRISLPTVPALSHPPRHTL